MIQVKNVGKEQKHYEGKIILKKVGIVILFIVLFAAAVLFFIFYTMMEYRPKSIEFNAGNGTKTLSEGDRFSVLTYNTGYGALSKDEDFFYGRWKEGTAG